MSRSGSQYDISRGSGTCAATGQSIDAGADFIATLVEREADDGFDRLDYTLEAWERGALPERLFSFWRTTAADRNAKPKPFLDDEILLNLYERLADDTRPQRQSFRFVLGLMLIRKKLLRFDHSEKGDGTEIWFVRRRGVPAGDPAEELVNPGLDDRAVESVTEQLSEVLSGDL